MDTNLIKTIYFYLVMAGCVLALSIGSYWFIRANLLKHVFTEASDDYYYSNPVRSYLGYYDCQYVLNLPNPSMNKDGSSVSEPQLTDEQKTECRTLLEEEAALQKERGYQNDMVSSILMILISSVVLGVHLKFVKR